MKTNFYSSLLLGKKHLLVLFIALSLFTVANAQTFRVWNPGVEFPAGGDSGPNANNNDGQPLETGMRFRVTQGGTVDSIRFYKGITSTGTHIGNIWDNLGNNIASVTFTGETASGWQAMKLAVPVILQTGITYTVSVFNADGVYNAEIGGLSSGGDDIHKGPFIIIGVTGSTVEPANLGNGSYVYSGTSAYPFNFALDGSNYWLDLAFTTFFPLPVGLTDFNANTVNTDVSLVWKTASETNNRGFEIQRSNNGADFYPVNFVNGVGESSTTRTYTYTDKGLAPGLYYYRLKQVDFDGHSKISSVVTARINGKGTVSLFPSNPNPVLTTGKIRFDLPQAQTIRLSIYDMNGKEVRLLANGKQESGSHIVTIDAAGLSKQLYFVRLQTETGILTSKIVVQ